VPLADSHHHVVVDGSNLATEGRSSPSLKQLDEAVRAYASEDPDANIIVVVDATFEHRVSEDERDEVRKAMLNGEVISPPAGAIGRGDAFVLRIAERTGATVLSNDSFQEFHGEHPWLFDEGRLIGGKPVPSVGWIFTPRVPIRGPKSRAATAEAKAKDDHASAPAKAAELARAAKKAAKRAGKSKKVSKKAAAAIVETSWPIRPNRPPPGRAKVDPVVSSAIEEAVEEALHPLSPEKPRGSSKKRAAAKKAPPQKSAKAKKDAPGGKAKSQAQSKPEPRSAEQRKNRSAPPPAVNEPLAFINFVAAFSVGSTIDGEVVSFTSHGAMVDVVLPAGGVLHCYIPLTAMGNPPPTKARKVLKKGEVRPFVLAGLDPPRRVAELALPIEKRPKKKRVGAPVLAVPAKKAGKKAARGPAATKKAPEHSKNAAAEKGPPAGSRAAKKQAKKAPSKKAKAPASVAPAKKQAKKAPSKKAKAPASVAPAKKAPKTKKAAKTAAAKTAGKQAPGAKKAPAKKAPGAGA
jgi:Zc3h12a-like ribonuclease protein